MKTFDEFKKERSEHELNNSFFLIVYLIIIMLIAVLVV